MVEARTSWWGNQGGSNFVVEVLPDITAFDKSPFTDDVLPRRQNTTQLNLSNGSGSIFIPCGLCCCWLNQRQQQVIEYLVEENRTVKRTNRTASTAIYRQPAVPACRQSQDA